MRQSNTAKKGAKTKGGGRLNAVGRKKGRVEEKTD